MSETCAENMDFEEGGRRDVGPGKRGGLVWLRRVS